MANFIKTTDIKLTGAQKAAILLGELYESSDAIYSKLNLSTKEMTKLKNAMTSLSPYNPDNPYHVKRETQVLEELMQFAAEKGYVFKPAQTEKPADSETNKVSSVSETIHADPDAVAKILRDWLK